MKKWVLPVRTQDKFIYDALEDSSKTIDTRAYSDKYAKIQEGDILVFSCAGKKLEKKVKKTRTFSSPEEMYKEVELKKVLPNMDSVEDAIKLHYSFPNYEEKLKKGIIAWDLE